MARLGLNEHFIVGRLKKRVLRQPIVEGWLCAEEAVRAPTREVLSFKKHGESLALPIPGGADLAKISSEATAALHAAESAEVLIGWPEHLVVIRSHGVVVYAEGDVVHFGRLALDREVAIERTDYEYLSDDGIEVRVELTMTNGETATTALLGPSDTTEIGAYHIEHGHSFDPSDRPSGARHHGYEFRVRRSGAVTAPIAFGDAPHPLDVVDPSVIVAIARSRGLFDADEALWAEPDELSARLDRYEGPRQSFESAVRDAGPTPPTLTRSGDAVIAESARLFRGSHGEAMWGRVRPDQRGHRVAHRPRHGAGTLASQPLTRACRAAVTGSLSRSRYWQL